jgi:hypothetical protein
MTAKQGKLEAPVLRDQVAAISVGHLAAGLVHVEDAKARARAQRGRARRGSGMISRI